MKEIHVQENHPTLSELIDTINQSKGATLITLDNNKKAILLSVDEWKSIQETLYLLSIPGVKDDLIEGKNTPWSDCTPLEELEW